MDRAIIVDLVPGSQQEESSAWASRMLGLGSIIGYLIGGANLTKAFGWISSSQIKLISLLAVAIFIITHALTCYAVTERVLLANAPSHSYSLLATLKSIWTTFRTLPLPIWRVMQAQLCSWIAMFALLFYSSTWVAEIYLKQNSNGADDLSNVSEEIADAATRAGSRALLLQSVIIFSTSVVLPFLVTSTGAAHTRSPPKERFRFANTDLAAEDDLSARVLTKLDSVYEWLHSHLPTLPFPWLRLPVAWGISQIAFTILMWSTWLVTGVVGASLIIALSGITMGMAMWAPFALVRLQSTF
jgi:solute carrier family 45 protein 1/2/4